MNTLFDYTVGFAIVMWHLVKISLRGDRSELPE